MCKPLQILLFFRRMDEVDWGDFNARAVCHSHRHCRQNILAWETSTHMHSKLEYLVDEWAKLIWETSTHEQMVTATSIVDRIYSLGRLQRSCKTLQIRVFGRRMDEVDIGDFNARAVCHSHTHRRQNILAWETSTHIKNTPN